MICTSESKTQYLKQVSNLFIFFLKKKKFVVYLLAGVIWSLPNCCWNCIDPTGSCLGGRPRYCALSSWLLLPCLATSTRCSSSWILLLQFETCSFNSLMWSTDSLSMVPLFIGFPLAPDCPVVTVITLALAGTDSNRWSGSRVESSILNKLSTLYVPFHT